MEFKVTINIPHILYSVMDDSYLLNKARITDDTRKAIYHMQISDDTDQQDKLMRLLDGAVLELNTLFSPYLVKKDKRQTDLTYVLNIDNFPELQSEAVEVYAKEFLIHHILFNWANSVSPQDVGHYMLLYNG